MAKKFDFGNSILEIEILNKEYKINAGSKSVKDALKKLAEETVEIAKLQESNEENVEEVYVKRLCETVKSFVEVTLGNGSYEEIFSDRIVDVLDHIELATHICNEIEKFKVNRLKKYMRN